MEHGLLIPCYYHVLGCQHHPGKAFISNAQGEVLAAAGLAKSIVGTAGIEPTMLRTSWPERQVPLLAADCVVALTIRKGVPSRNHW